jgi:hypothetical protein
VRHHARAALRLHLQHHIVRRARVVQDVAGGRLVEAARREPIRQAAARHDVVEQPHELVDLGRRDATARGAVEPRGERRHGAALDAVVDDLDVVGAARRREVDALLRALVAHDDVVHHPVVAPHRPAAALRVVH